MGIHIIVLFIVLIVLLSIRKKIAETAASVERRVESIKDFITHPNVVATSIGKVLLDQVTKKISRIFGR